MAYNYVEVERNGSIVTVWLNRPEKLNALNTAMWRELGQVFGEVCSGDHSVVVLRGRGRALSAGDDIYEMYSLKTLDEARKFFSVAREALERIAKCPKPVIAVLSGLAAGGGAEILLVVDYVIATKGSWISYPESLIGLIPPVLATAGVLAVGLRRAKMLALTGMRLEADEAMRLGIVDEVVESEALVEERIREVSSQLSSAPAQSVAAVKELVWSVAADAFEKALAQLAQLVVSSEARARMQKFIEERSRRGRQTERR
jgi:isohexenylglutaconyl-CoA hydratase